MTTILSHQEDLGPSMLNVKYEGLRGTGLVTTPLNMAPNLSECNVSHGGIAQKLSKIIWCNMAMKAKKYVVFLRAPVNVQHSSIFMLYSTERHLSGT